MNKSFGIPGLAEFEMKSTLWDFLTPDVSLAPGFFSENINVERAFILEGSIDIVVKLGFVSLYNIYKIYYLYFTLFCVILAPSEPTNSWYLLFSYLFV